MQETLRKERAAPGKEHHASDLRSALEWLRGQGDLIETDKPVDPDLEITGLQKHLDGGCPVLFNNVKGKPHHRVVGIDRSEEHTSELQSRPHLVCRLLLEKKNG